jgi:chromosome segregation ATPase
MSQLIGESVALQRQLEHRAVSEKTLRADVSALTEQLLELKKRFASYDVDMRELAERLAEATAACAKHDRDSIKQRAEVNELRTTAEHAEARATSLSALLAQRAGDASDAQAAKAKAEGESRLARLELEQTTDALAKLQDDCKFLIMENAQLQAASSSSAAAAALSEKERTRMLDELDRSKVERALTKFMFRKQRDKYLETAELHRETKEQIADNFRELARASQRYDDLERELRTARRRAAVKEDHYATQEADAAKLAQENRLLLERATQMGALIEQLRADLTVANKVHGGGGDRPDGAGPGTEERTARPRARARSRDGSAPPPLPPPPRAQEGDEAKATAKILKDRDALARVLSNFRVDDFRSMMDQNREVAGHIQTLLGALAPAPST